MKLKVPFLQQTTNLNCGPMALKMILSYFGEDIDINIIEKKSRLKKDKGFSTGQIALASIELGFKTRLFTIAETFNLENMELDFYKKYAHEDLEWYDKILEEAKGKGVEVNLKSISIEEIQSLITENSIPIILLDWNIIKDKKDKGYQGHFVVIVGYDKDNIYVHNHGLKSPKPFLSIKKEIFDEARKAKGTEEEIVVIYKN